MAKRKNRQRKNPSLPAIGAGIALAIGLGLLAYASSGSLPAGVTTSEGVTLSSRQIKFLTRLRSAVPSTVPIHVTSGGRTYEEQATLMMRKWATYPDEFKRIYGSAATRLLRLPLSYSTWLAEIKRMYADGTLDSDQHTGGGAVDLRTRDLPSGGLQALNDASRTIGASPLIEADHLHIAIKDAA